MSEHIVMKKQNEMDNVNTIEETLRRFKKIAMQRQEKAQKQISEQVKVEEQTKKAQQDQRKEEFEDYQTNVFGF